jgi:putative membrane protein
MSVLDPAGPQAGSIASLWWVFEWLSIAVYVIVVIVFVVATIRASAAAVPRFTRVWRVLTLPALALGFHAAARIAWHVPALFDAALADERIHAFQHLTFFVTAVLFWSSLVYGRYGRFGYGVRVAFVFCTMLYTGLLAAVITLGQHALYAHAEPTLRWGLDPVEDQQRAGLLMWIPCAVVMTSIGLAIFAAWLGQAERAAAREERPE